MGGRRRAKAGRSRSPAPFRRQLLYAFLGLSLLPFVVWGLIEYWHARASLAAIEQQGWMALGLLTVGTLAVWGAFWLSHRFAEPLVQLSRAVRSLPEGRFVLPAAAARTTAEYAVLGEAMQQAAHELDRRRRAIEAHQQNLETMVRQRTAALEATNRIIIRLAGTLHLRDALSAIAPLLDALVPCDYLAIFQYHQQTDTIRILMQYPTTPSIVEPGDQPLADRSFSEALRARQTWCVSDLRAAPGPGARQLAENGYRSLLAVPVQGYNGQVLGVLCLASHQTDAYTNADADRLTAVCEQIGMVMQRDELVQDLDQRRADAENASRLTTSLSQLLRLDQVAPRVLTEMRQAFAADRADLWLFEADGETTCCAASIGHLAEQVRGRCVSRRLNPAAAAALTDQQYWLIQDLQAQPVAPTGLIERLGMRSLAALRLLSAGDAIGVIVLAYRCQKGFPEARLNYALALAAQAAAAVANAQLYQRLVDSLAQQQQVQTQLIRSERMSAIGQLASTVAHEIKNRFNVIQAAAFLVEMIAGRPDSAEKVKETVGKIKREVERGNALMMSLLQYARPKEPKRETVDLTEVIETALAIARRANVAVKRVLPTDLPPMYGDPALLEQVFVNLFLNAVQAMPSGGQLTVTAEADNGCIEVRVSDTGTGISEADQAKLFQPFFTTKTGGTGLGLLITRQILDQHDSSIRCESRLGEGATFILRLPVQEAGISSLAA